MVKSVTSKKQQWQKMSDANLVKYVPSGTLYARVRINGKFIRKSLDTKTLSVARLRLQDFIKELRKKPKQLVKQNSFEELVDEHLKKSEANYRIKPRTKEYHQECVKMLKKYFPEIFPLNITSLTKKKCSEMTGVLAEKYSATRFNGLLTFLKGVFTLAADKGILYDNPILQIKRMPVRQKELKLPSQKQFSQIISILEKFTPEGAVLIKFLAFSGCRIDEARHVTWGDVLEDEIIIRGNPITRTKNSEIRQIPIIEPMKELLEEIHPEVIDSKELIIKNHDCRKGLIHACKESKCESLSHHDFRHLFATRCIESDVDIPTVSRWLGHKDGGALAMKTYGHLRNEHSIQMGKKVKF